MKKEEEEGSQYTYAAKIHRRFGEDLFFSKTFF